MDDRAAGWPEDSWIKPEHSLSEVRHLVDEDNSLVNSHNAVRSTGPLGRIVAAILRPLHAPLTHDPSHRRIDAAIAAAADAITTSIDGLVEPTEALGEHYTIWWPPSNDCNVFFLSSSLTLLISLLLRLRSFFNVSVFFLFFL